jgi:hypothetical protein
VTRRDVRWAIALAAIAVALGVFYFRTRRVLDDASRPPSPAAPSHVGVRIEVRDAVGRPLEGAEVRLDHRLEGTWRKGPSAVTDSRGFVDVGGLPACDVQAVLLDAGPSNLAETIDAKGQFNWMRSSIATWDGRTPVVVRLECAPSAWFDIRCSEPIEDEFALPKLVVARPKGAGAWRVWGRRYAVTPRDPRSLAAGYRVGPFAPGEYRVSIRRFGRAPTGVAVSLDATFIPEIAWTPGEPLPPLEIRVGTRWTREYLTVNPWDHDYPYSGWAGWVAPGSATDVGGLPIGRFLVLNWATQRGFSVEIRTGSASIDVPDPEPLPAGDATLLVRVRRGDTALGGRTVLLFAGSGQRFLSGEPFSFADLLARGTEFRKLVPGTYRVAVLDHIDGNSNGDTNSDRTTEVIVSSGRNEATISW